MHIIKASQNARIRPLRFLVHQTLPDCFHTYNLSIINNCCAILFITGPIRVLPYTGCPQKKWFPEPPSTLWRYRFKVLSTQYHSSLSIHQIAKPHIKRDRPSDSTTLQLFALPVYTKWKLHFVAVLFKY